MGRIVYCSGMYGSGSTAYWNLIKFIYDILGKEYSFAAASRRSKISYKEIENDTRKKDRDLIIKVHEFSSIEKLQPDNIRSNDKVFLSYREQRHFLAGYQLSFNKTKKAPFEISKMFKTNMEIFNQWSSISGSKIINFNDIVWNPEAVVESILKELNFKLTRGEIIRVIHKMKNIPTDNYRKYRLSESNMHNSFHCGTYRYDWENILENEIKEELLKYSDKVYF